MRVKHVVLFKFEELPEQAQKAALERYRNWNVEGFNWWDVTYYDAKQIGNLLGLDIRNIWFSGFWSQGDGACFEGSYEYAKGSPKAIREYAPQDAELHRIADKLAALQRAYFYRLCAYVKHSGHYQHEYCTDIDVAERDESLNATRPLPETEIVELLRSFMRWIYRQLEQEYEYQVSDEAVRESLIANEVEFTADGRIAHEPEA